VCWGATERESYLVTSEKSDPTMVNEESDSVTE
jgi:hypothetical protein